MSWAPVGKCEMCKIFTESVKVYSFCIWQTKTKTKQNKKTNKKIINIKNGNGFSSLIVSITVEYNLAI